MHALCLSRILRLSTDSKLFHLAMKDLLIDRDTYLPPSQEVSRLSGLTLLQLQMILTLYPELFFHLSLAVLVNYRTPIKHI
jgi:hypothetical protein